MVTWRDDETDALVEQACRGDLRAREELFERYRPRLRRLLRCRLDPRVQRRVDASDVIQETLLLASRDLDSYQKQPGVPFYAWLRQIAWQQLLRTSQQHIRTQRQSVLKEEILGWEHSRGPLISQLITASTPSKEVMREELEQNVAAALDELSKSDREILVLCYLEQLRSTEVAAVLGISEPACRMRLMRALERLRHVLGDPREES